MQRKINNTMIYLRIGKTYTAKTPSGNFKVTTLENPLLSKQAVTNKGILVPYTNLQLNPYPNTQLDLFCSDNSSFRCTTPSTWLTNCADPSTRLQSQQVVTSKGIPVPYANIQLNSYPNAQLDLFCSDNFPFWCMAPKYVTNQCADPGTRLQSPTREGCWLQSSSVHPNNED